MTGAPDSPPDPAPRRYPATVTLLRRSSRGPAGLAARIAPEALEPWLLGAARLENDLLLLFEALVWRLVRSGCALDRATLHVGTLHPQIVGFSWVWNSADGYMDEIQVSREALSADSFTRNPISHVIRSGEAFRCDLSDPAAVAPWPLMAELRAEGLQEYLAEPAATGDFNNVITLATRTAGGFGAEQTAYLRRCFAVFSLLIGRHIAMRIAGNILDTYLGPEAGRQVLDGTIERGSGSAVDAVIWMSDLRGFTDLMDRLPGDQVLALMNAYFEAMAGAVMAHGGEVLKFIGDGLLAAFPLDAGPAGSSAAPAARALAAARDALRAVADLAAHPPPELAVIEGWRPLRSGIALHEGEVFFGNVGAPKRLDFTVIGRAVNAASRVEALCKTLGRTILVTEPVATRLEEPLEDLGPHRLPGLAEPMRVYAVMDGSGP